MLRKNWVVIDWSACAVLVSICDSLKSISQLDKYFLLVSVLAAPSDIDFWRRDILRVYIESLVGVVLFQPVIRLLVFHTHIALLNYNDENVHYNTIELMVIHNRLTQYS
jgi:hypothetical protein